MDCKNLIALFKESEIRIKGIMSEKIVAYIIYLMIQYRGKDCYELQSTNVKIKKLSYRDFLIQFVSKPNKKITLYLAGSYKNEKDDTVSQKTIDNLGYSEEGRYAILIQNNVKIIDKILLKKIILE